MLAVPLVCDDVSIQAVILSSTVDDPFTEKQIELLQTFANQAVIAIEDVTLFKETSRVSNRQLTEALEQQTATSEILRVIASSPTDLQPVFQTILRQCSAALRSEERCGVQIWARRRGLSRCACPGV